MPGIFIEEMKISNLKEYANISRADFEIHYRYLGLTGENRRGQYKRTLGFATDSKNRLSECNPTLDRAKACQRVGALWVEAEERCDICGLLGGTWQRQKCLI